MSVIFYGGTMRFSVMLQQLGGGMLKSMSIFALTLLFALPLGLFVSFGRMSKNKILQGAMKVYISIMRGTPLMLQLLAVYFGPYYLFGANTGSSPCPPGSMRRRDFWAIQSPALSSRLFSRR